ncbi:neuronal acetylcholine receptor subunit alpha-2-like [Anopheles maculipalpis]|uniref:neuronal acetylcholine receptor subunit alpha-2-like n=1 Tax=Anopheles maculipalpis TaxID=1496333 RepID=UPI0021596271|nr:neuronal acetylcholine receptor subunit alpha-2-like [Anopheles maculipalpis]
MEIVNLIRCTLFLVFIILKPASSITCKKETSNTKNLLKQNLFCNGYDPKVRPAKSEFDTIKITSTAFVTEFDVKEYRRVLKVQILYHMVWADRSLKWNSSDWSNITVLYLNRKEIWLPQFEHINAGHREASSLGCHHLQCKLQETGRIVCLTICTLTVDCSLDYSRWPYSTMDCHMWFSNHDKELVDEINFFPLRTFMALSENPHANKWCMTAFTSKETTLDIPGATGHTVQELGFSLQHTPHTVLATIYFPAFALVMLNIFVCWLQSPTIEKTKIILISLVCHFVILDAISIRSIVVPDVVLFINTSMVLTMLLFVITLILRWLNDLHSTPPRTIKRWTVGLTNTRVMDWFLRTEYLSLGHKPIAITNYVELRDWPMIVRLVDRSVFVLYAFIYLLLFWIYIPLQHDKHSIKLRKHLCSN